jgi:hypothetical protein
MEKPEPMNVQHKRRQWLKLRVNPSTLVRLINWGVVVGSVVSVGILAWLAIGYLLSDQAAQFATRLTLVSSLSTMALVIITGAYVYITAKTLNHLREERLTVAEPLVYMTLKTVRLNPENVLTLCLENFGKGPALRLIGEYRTRSSSVGGDTLRRNIDKLPDVLSVGEVSQITLGLPSDVTDLLPVNGREDGFLAVRLVFEDARRNLYVYRLSLSLIATDRRWYVQENNERLWRIPPHERHYIFDSSNLSLVVEHGRKPLFARSLL